MHVTPLGEEFVAEITRLDLSAGTESIPVEDFRAAMDRYAVCVIRNETPVRDEDQIAFSGLFGPVDLAPTVGRFAERNRSPHREIFPGAGNLDSQGNILPEDDFRRIYSRGNLLWHTDASFKKVRAVYSFLGAHIVPPAGADTQYCDMRAAYDALPESLKRKIEDLVAEHSIWRSRTLTGYPEPTQEELDDRPPAPHKVVQVHPGSGRKTLYLAEHATHIVGWPVEEGRALIDELVERATRPEFVYSHKWRVGDLVVWDNRCTMHRATPFEDMTYKRDLRRTTAMEAPASA